MQYSFWLSGRTRCIKNKQRIFGSHMLRRTVRRGFCHGFVIPDIPFGIASHGIAGALNYYGGVNIRAAFQGFFHVSLKWNILASSWAFIRGDDNLAIRIQNAVFQCLRRKATENYGMYCTNSRTGQHRHSRFGNHGHINRNPVAFLHPSGFEHIRELTN